MMHHPRDQLRRGLNRLFGVAMAPLVHSYRLERRLLERLGPAQARRLLQSYGGLLGLWPGFSGDLARRAFYRAALRDMDGSVTISQGSGFSSDDVAIGAGVYIGSGCVIGACRIGEAALLADYVHVLPGRHTHRFRDSGELDTGDEIPVRIGAHTWIGAHAIVMADVGARSIVGAGAVVVRPVPDDVVAAGNPARIVKRLRPAAGPPAPGGHGEAPEHLNDRTISHSAPVTTKKAG